MSATVAQRARRLLLTALVLSSVGTTHAELVLEFPAHQYVAHDAHADIALVAANDGGIPVRSFVIQGEYWGKNEFTLSNGPRSQCGELRLVHPTASDQPTMLRITVPSLAPGERRECHVRALRHPVPIAGNSGSLLLWRTLDAAGAMLPRTTERRTMIGSYADIKIRTQTLSLVTLPDGRHQSVHRIAVTNAGPEDVLPQRLDTCARRTTPLALDVNLPDGCGVSSQICINDVPGNAFELPHVRAGETRACHIRLTSLPGLSLETPYFAGSTEFRLRSGETALDLYPADNTVHPDVSWDGAIASNASVPATGSVARSALSALLAVVAGFALRRRHRNPRS